jgi:hypothetical protein
MAKTSKWTTVKLWQETLKKLRFISAHTGESIAANLERLTKEELERLEKEVKNESK